LVALDIPTRGPSLKFAFEIISSLFLKHRIEKQIEVALLPLQALVIKQLLTSLKK
jgi:hypothetical protein